jgi:hypothetical protein
MTEELKMQIITNLIQTAPIYSETREWCVEFSYFKILTQTWESEEYKLIRTNIWEPVYNLENELGGYSNVSSVDELIVLQGV